jgi:hypothetical protein
MGRAVRRAGDGGEGLTAMEASDMSGRERLLDELRPPAFRVAYRMLGSVSEAEDIVQDPEDPACQAAHR